MKPLIPLIPFIGETPACFMLFDHPRRNPDGGDIVRDIIDNSSPNTDDKLITPKHDTVGKTRHQPHFH